MLRTGAALSRADICPAAEQKFWAKVVKSDGCWMWTGGQRRPLGYGRVSLPGHREAYAHRVSPVSAQTTSRS